MVDPASRERGVRPPASDEHARALAEIALGELRLMALALAPLYVVFAALNYAIVESARGGALLAIEQLALAGGLAALGLAIHRGRVPARLAHGLGLALAVAIVANNALVLRVTGDEARTVLFFLVAAGVAFVLLRPGTLALALLANALGFLVSGGATALVPALVASSALAVAIHVTRSRGLARVIASQLAYARKQRELEETVDAATAAERHYRLLAETSSDMIVRFAPDATISYSSPAVRTILGFEPREIAQRNAFELVHPEDAPRLKPLFRALLTGERETAQATYRALAKDGSWKWVEASARRVATTGEDARLLEVVAIVRDVGERMRAAEEAERSRERAATIERLTAEAEFRTQVLNIVAHELRTPLTPIRTQVYLLERAGANGNPEARERAIAMLSRNVARLAAVVDDILDVAHLQARRLDLRKEEVDLAKLAAEAAASYADVAERSGIELELDVPQESLLVSADGSRLAQVVANLLSNAVKFTPAGGRVIVRARAVSGHAEVEVTDTGMGLPPEKIMHLFQPFSRVGASAETRPGTGLGLFICRGILEAHGGWIRAESEGVGRGTTMRFAVPR